jgi:DUF1009 family protein
MGRRIGLVAGSGAIPRFVLEDARARGWSAAVAAVRGEADPGLAELADAFEWIGPWDVAGLVGFFRRARVGTVFLVGKVGPRTALESAGAEAAALELLAKAGDRTPGALLRVLIDHLAGQGLAVEDPGVFFERFLCPSGVLTGTEPVPAVLEDIGFGWPLVKRIADEEIGQTLVVKERAVVAVEGMEGTDRAILRAGHLAGGGTVVLKAGRRRQDPRIDLPAVGIGTVRSLVEARAAALCIEAEAVPFFQKEEALALADANGIAVLARTG